MDKDNKIISFKNRKKAKFKLKVKISIHIIREGERYTISWYSSDETFSEKEIYLIQLKIFETLIKEIDCIKYKENDYYETEITLLYYEKANRHFKYICIPQNIEKEKLAEYLLVSTRDYELKKSDTI